MTWSDPNETKPLRFHRCLVLLFSSIEVHSAVFFHPLEACPPSQFVCLASPYECSIIFLEIKSLFPRLDDGLLQVVETRLAYDFRREFFLWWRDRPFFKKDPT